MNMLTAYLNVNFNKMLETLIFQRSYFILFALHMRDRFGLLLWDRLELACGESVKQTTG